MKFSYNSKLKKSISWKKLLPIVLGVVALVILVSLLSLRQWYENNLKPLSDTYSEQITVISSGSSTAAIAAQLDEEELIRSARAFDWYVNNFDSDQFLQAGTYKLSPSLSAQDIAQILLDGRVDTNLVTIPPGVRLDELATSLVKSGFSEAEVDAALVASYSHPIFKGKPSGAGLEGYIFPETYQTTDASSAQSVIERSLDEFYDQLSDEIMAAIAKQGLSLYEAITLASIVQKEVSDPATQKQVAQVFLKRLKQGTVLGSDVTFIYAAEVAGDEPTVDYDSPYNTRIHAGLPPGPISNFNFIAFEAVANPAEGEYLFFVAGDDGNTYFANTLAQHQANAAKYCIELCKL